MKNTVLLEGVLGAHAEVRSHGARGLEARILLVHAGAADPGERAPGGPPLEITVVIAPLSERLMATLVVGSRVHVTGRLVSSSVSPHPCVEIHATECRILQPGPHALNLPAATRTPPAMRRARSFRVNGLRPR